MKSLLVSLALVVCSSSAFAKADFYKGEKLNVVRKNGAATSLKGEVKLVQYRSCGFAERCIGSKPDLIVSLKNGKEVIETFRAELSATTDECGSIVYTASRDMRPADGALTQIEVMDNSDRLCRDRRPGIIEVRVKTVYVSRMSAQEIVTKYELLQTVEPDSLANGIELPKVTLNSKEEQNGSNGFVQVVKSKKLVRVSYDHTSCPQDIDGNGLPVACPTVLYKKALELKLESVKKDACGSVIYHAVPAQPLPLGSEYNEVTVTDNRSNKCESFVALPAIEVKGRTSYPYPGRSTTEFTMTK